MQLAVLLGIAGALGEVSRERWTDLMKIIYEQLKHKMNVSPWCLVTKPRQRALQAWRHTPVGLALGRLEVGGSRVQSQPGLHENPFQKQKQNPSNYLLTSAKRSFLFLALVNLTQSDNIYFERRKGRKSDKSIPEFSWIGNSLSHFFGLLCWTKEYALDTDTFRN